VPPPDEPQFISLRDRFMFEHDPDRGDYWDGYNAALGELVADGLDDLLNAAAATRVWWGTEQQVALADAITAYFRKAEAESG
jgi:hypothetical protein